MALRDTQQPAPPTTQKLEFSAAEIGALAHLYRGEVYRSTAWRTRLDSTTNWAVVTTGIALSATYSRAEASALPMVLVGLSAYSFCSRRAATGISTSGGHARVYSRLISTRP